MATVDELLSSMHKELVEELIRKVRSGEATAADLNVARQMLKDNNITATAKPGSPLQQLTDSLPFTGDEEGAYH